MDVIVQSKNCEVPERLRAEAIERVRHATRFFDRLSAVEMAFSEEHNPRIRDRAVVEVTARAKRHHIRAEGAGEDHWRAVEVAVTRFERQLARYKARLVDRTQRGGKPVPNGALVGEAVTEPDERVPRIVRTKQFELVPMVPEDAALQLELLGHDFFLFENAATGACNLLYRRRDGDLGLIEAVR